MRLSDDLAIPPPGSGRKRWLQEMKQSLTENTDP